MRYLLDKECSALLTACWVVHANVFLARSRPHPNICAIRSGSTPEWGLSQVSADTPARVSPFGLSVTVGVSILSAVIMTELIKA